VPRAQLTFFMTTSWSPVKNWSRSKLTIPIGDVCDNYYFCPFDPNIPNMICTARPLEAGYRGPYTNMETHWPVRLKGGHSAHTLWTWGWPTHLNVRRANTVRAWVGPYALRCVGRDLLARLERANVHYRRTLRACILTEWVAKRNL